LLPELTIPYRTVANQDLSLHLPRIPNQVSAGLVFIHGGGWVSGSPEKLYELSFRLAENGIVCCLPQYRLRSPPDIKFPEQIEDVQLAWAFAHNYLRDRFGADLPIAFGGGSAGGHLSMMALHRSATTSTDLPKPSAWILANPVADTSSLGFGNAMCGPQWQELSPLHALTHPLGRVLYLQGMADTVTRPTRAAAFIAQQRLLGSSIQTIWYPNEVHGFFNSPENRSSTARQIAGFIKASSKVA
jgi:acetyl esterase